MLRKSLAVLYTALALGANPVAADVAALRIGDMKKLALHSAPVALAEVGLLDADDAPKSMADYHGKWVVLNFWATWCAPCRHEMPSLDRLQAALPDIAVVPVATGRNAVPGIRKFYAEAGITNLPILRDPKSELSRSASVMALPVTLILNPQGQEVARLIGDAEWDSDSAKAILSALAAQ
ncbi:TlpA family protein disulfide reductase [Pseudotabrizicola sediminis]|uniref:TlpA family protein disulfide reductase n=1 Tax=Pseudotabrizicola sediminis TaxID=2486418 RepID=A0ABY2KSY4_9RHOB|nr:TlpA disulfide reductase family protein [Pseudotabrizicola sediminis]TGD44615.1 TlpA family protein disulfide reductase [Pseudotabrizicola sediminis]TGD67518.1 TlpA family protein disulfide reductase [Tabrizicola sp. WMC-M-20]